MSLNKKLFRRLRERETLESKTSIVNNDMVDLFGLENLSISDTQVGNEKKQNPKKKVRAVRNISDDEMRQILPEVFSFLSRQQDLLNLRRVNKIFHETATERFREIHDAVRISSDTDINRFDEDVAHSKHFPFGRFKLILENLPKFRLVKFAKQYEKHIHFLNLTPFVDVAYYRAHTPQQLLFKMKEVMMNTKEVKELDIQFPSLSTFDYISLDFDNPTPFMLENLRVLSIGFVSNGFCSFTADFAIGIINSSQSLKKLRMKLSEPTDGAIESEELTKFLGAARRVPTISVFLTLGSNQNQLLNTLCSIVTNRNNTRIRHLTLAMSRFRTEMYSISDLLAAQSETLISLKLFRHSGGHPSELLVLPKMKTLESLIIDTTSIRCHPLNKDQFANLKSLALHLKYGNDSFFLQSILDQESIEELTLYCKDVSILSSKQEHKRFNLPNLETLNLVNPPLEFIKFFFKTATPVPNIETLCVAVIGGDPTYPIGDILSRLSNSKEISVGLDTFLSLNKLYLFMPIDEKTAELLAVDLDPLTELVAGDSEVSKTVVKELRKKHEIYISWKEESMDLPKLILSKSGIQFDRPQARQTSKPFHFS